MEVFFKGMRDALPIGAGYFTVAFSLGIVATKAGLGAGEGFISSLLTRASAGEFGSYTLMAAGAAYIEIFAMCIIANLRYLLMGTAMIQKFAPGTPQWKRILASVCITDEVFAISIAYGGKLPPSYTFGAMTLAAPMWAFGTTCGIIAGNIMPPSVVSALGISLYGMFIAIIVGPAKKDRAILLSVIASFLFSVAFAYLPFTKELSYGIKVVVLTVLISATAALIKPVGDEE